MISSLRIQNFALFQHMTWEQHGAINVIVGKNDTGKSHLLKLLYALVKSVEEFSKGRPPKDWSSVLANKLTWTFQTEQLAELIHRGQKQASVDLTVNAGSCSFALTSAESSKGTLLRTKDPAPQETLNTIFVPPKELLTAFEAIEATREKLEIFGFDDTYYDLIKALRLPTTKGKIDEHLLRVLKSLETMFGGEIAKGRGDSKFVFQCNGQTFSMSQTAEGIKKLGILTTLIRNRTLGKGSVLFLDEPETNLHPDYIVKLMTMLMDLSRAGIQIYLATHSYFVIKQLHILAKEQQAHVPFCSLTREGATVRADFSDLLDGMPDNPIIDEAIALYQRELSLDLKR
jgi:predicted ATPase